MKITGKLECARIEGRVAIGLIYDDIHKRFQDGQPVRTSTLQKILVKDGTTYLQTLNSVYEVVGKLEGQLAPVPKSKEVDDE